ncbi:glycosyltransferase 87 family protein [Kitasatospora sp. NPDC052896]|uniref:glycosyltransferase 87 family protein n=1 Tax=Kitasatospora sp. NPDC052896 TaxID=3364061 RepID=UPI0037CC01D9
MSDRGSPSGPARLRSFLRTRTALAAAASLISLMSFAVLRHFQNMSMVDMLVYRAEGAAVWNHQDLYAMRLPGWDLPATYPPFAAMLFVPSSWFDVTPLRAIVTLLNVALLGLLAYLAFKLVGWPRERHRLIGAILVAGFGVWLEPVYTTLQYGQVNLGIACLVLYDFTRPDNHRYKGVGIGLAAGIKLVPGLFAVYLLLTGRIRAALVAGGTFLASALIGVVTLPGASWGYWTDYMWDTRRVGITELVDNQSLRGAICRLLSRHDPGMIATVGTGLALLLGLSVAVVAGRSARVMRRAEAWGVICAALTSLLVSPISWTHHYVWCVPLLILLLTEAVQEAGQPSGLRRLRWRPAFVAVLLAFLSYAMWLVPQAGGLGVPWNWQVPSSVYPVTSLAVLGAMAYRMWPVGRDMIRQWQLGRAETAQEPARSAALTGQR